jgi:hypothetical protein
MSDIVQVLKDECNETPVPSIWRNTFSALVQAFQEGDFSLTRGIAGVRPISAKGAARIENNIKSYGARLTSLPDETWQTSVCQWMRGYWDVLVDLYTVEEGASDLALDVRVYEDGSGYAFEVQSIYAP